MEPLLALAENALENLEIENALKYARQALKVNPQSVYARNLLISGLCRQRSLVRGGKERWSRLLRKHDRNPTAWHLALADTGEEAISKRLAVSRGSVSQNFRSKRNDAELVPHTGKTAVMRSRPAYLPRSMWVSKKSGRH